MKIRLGLALCLTALSALTTAAQADTREQVMLRLPRCAAVMEPRGYLDCYYAAVQPMRTELGLAAAPQAATYGALFTASAAPVQGTLTPQAAATREDVLLRLTRCSAIGDTRQYMDCYYAAAQPLRADLGLAAAPQAATYAPLFSLTQSLPASQRYAATSPLDQRANLVPQTAYLQGAATAARPRVQGDGPTDLPWLGSLIGISKRKVPEAQYGFRNVPTAANGVDHVASPVASFVFTQTNKDFIVTLENGQVWRQVAFDDSRARWQSSTKGKLATVAYGAGESYNLTVGDGNLYKVYRVK